MDEVRGMFQEEQLVITLSGHIDSGNAAEVEKECLALTSTYEGKSLTVDAQDLNYISSAGLRILLRLRKSYNDLRIINVNPEIYEILDMTGFTQMMTVEKAYRIVSVEGCEKIGEGANGAVYRIDGDNVVKVYKNADALEEIQHEREVARLALVLGIPTAISYDVVRVGGSYGSVFEMLDARSFSKILAEQPEKMDWCVWEYVDLLKLIHHTVVPEGELPDMRQTVIGWARFMQDYLPEKHGQKLMQMVEAVPKDDHMIHGDYHTKNLQLTGDEVLLIDMDTLAVGNPIFELGSMYNAFVGFGEYDNSVTRNFLGIERERAVEFWNRALAAYLGTENEEKIREVENKARIIGYTRLIRRSIRRHGLESPEGVAEIELWKSRLIELLEETDTLLFTMNEITIEAKKENLPIVEAFAEKILDGANCQLANQMRIMISIEEIFVNIASYAYAPGTGSMTMSMDVREDAREVVITFVDRGIPYDPLAKEDPDVTLSAEERQIGGLGIFMVKQSMDDLQYQYRNGQNILTLKRDI